MLNKELLLLATGSQTEGHIKLTVGNGGASFGYSLDALQTDFGSVSKAPCWNVNGKPLAMSVLVGDNNSTFLWIDQFKFADDITEITVTIVEKELTVTLVADDYLSYYNLNTMAFNSSDVGKTFTIVFDPEPTGYV